MSKAALTVGEVKDISGEMEMPLEAIRDFGIAICFICEGGEGGRLTVIQTIAHEIVGHAENLIHQRAEMWRALNAASHCDLCDGKRGQVTRAAG